MLESLASNPALDSTNSNWGKKSSEPSSRNVNQNFKVMNTFRDSLPAPETYEEIGFATNKPVVKTSEFNNLFEGKRDQEGDHQDIVRNPQS